MNNIKVNMKMKLKNKSVGKYFLVTNGHINSESEYDTFEDIVSYL